MKIINDRVKNIIIILTKMSIMFPVFWNDENENKSNGNVNILNKSFNKRYFIRFFILSNNVGIYGFYCYFYFLFYCLYYPNCYLYNY